MFIALCLSRLFLTPLGAISLRLSHPQLAPLGAECVNPHGKYLLTDLHPNRFRSERSAFPHTTRLQRGAVQVHNRDCSQQRTETDLNQRNVGSRAYSDWLRPAMALANLVREIKADSTNLINKKKWVRGRFSWQEGYGAFSYGHSQLNTVTRYIQNQEKHHQRHSFRNEYMTLLRKFDIAFDDRYVFKFIE